MASPKTSPLSIDDLIQGQRDLMSRADISEKQLEIAKQQLKRLEDIKKQEQLANAEAFKEDRDVMQITKKKGDASHVSLGDVRDEVKGLRNDLQGNTPGRKPLPLMSIGPDGAGSQTGESDEQRKMRLTRIGAAIGGQQSILYGDVNKQTAQARNTETYEKFIRETGNKNELLANATDAQKKIFERLEETLIQLREDDGKNSLALRKEIAKLGGEISATDDNYFRQKATGIVGNVAGAARTGARGDKGNLGDALNALLGKTQVLKSGYEFDPRMGASGIRRTQANEFGKKGGLAATKKGEVPGMGRLAGAATIAGNFFKGKVEQFNNQYKSDAIPNFMDNNLRAGPTGREKAAALEGQKQVMIVQAPAAAPADTGPGMGDWLGRASKPAAGPGLMSRIPGGLLKGGAAALGGLALGYGADKLKESGHEKIGGAADVAAQAATWGGTGAMLGSVVPGVGTAIGAGVGAVAGGAYGLYKNWGNFFGGGGTGAASPAAAAPVETQRRVGALSADNAAARSADAKPIVINTGSSAPAAPAQVTQNMLLPRGNVRAQESAIEMYSRRQAAFY